MKTFDVFLDIVGGFGIFVVLYFMIGVWLRKRVGINKSEMTKLRRDHARQREEIRAVEDAAREYSDLDSPLAAKIRAIISASEKEREDL